MDPKNKQYECQKTMTQKLSGYLQAIQSLPSGKHLAHTVVDLLTSRYLCDRLTSLLFVLNTFWMSLFTNSSSFLHFSLLGLIFTTLLCFYHPFMSLFFGTHCPLPGSTTDPWPISIYITFTHCTHPL